VSNVKPVLQALLLADRIYEDKATGKKIVAGIFQAVFFKKAEDLKAELEKRGVSGAGMPGGFHAGAPYAYISLTDLRGTQPFILRYVDLGEDKPVFEAAFTAEAVAHQRSIISRELADRLTTTSALAELFTWQIAFTEHPYRRPVPGEPDQINSLGVEAVRAFYDNLYHPNNAALVAVGDVQPDSFFELAKQAFGDYPSGQLPDPPAPEPPQAAVRTRIEYLEESSTLLEFAWHGPGIADKREVCAVDLIYIMLSNELESMSRQFEQDSLLQAAVVNYLTQRWPGLFTITAVTHPAHELDLRSAILDKINYLRTNLVSEEVVANAKQAIYAEYAFSNEAYTDQVESLAFYEAIDTYEFAVNYIDLVNQITPQQIQQAAQKYLDPDGYSLVVIRPKRAGEGIEGAWLR